MTTQINTNPVDKAEMARIEAGEFIMGSRYEQPLHTVRIDEFWIYRKQVTNAQYQLFCASLNKPLPEEPVPDYIIKYPNYPVVKVTWDEAKNYAHWAGGRLPTEAEWEKAARGGLQDKIYPWGNKEPDQGEWANFKYYDGNLKDQRIPFDSKGRGPLPCGMFPPNGFGLFDMAGNAWEWVEDFYDPDYYYISPRKNPTGPLVGETRVRRGGGWGRSALSLRCACRSSMPPDIRDARMGFRVVVEDL